MSKKKSLVADDTNEYLEEYTKEGKRTGKKIVRGVAHSEGLWHAVSHVWITDTKGNLLLQKRSELKKAFPGCYDVSAAGHVSYGMTPEDSAVEEIWEELGMKTRVKDLELVGTFFQVMVLLQGTYINKEVVFCYHLELEELNLDELSLQESELDGSGIVFWDVFRDMLIKKDKRVVEVDTDTEYLKAVWKLFETKYHKYSRTSDDFIQIKSREIGKD